MIKGLKSLTVAFLLIAMLSHATPALAEENFGLGANVEVKVERALQDQFVIEDEQYLPFYIIISLIAAFGVVLLLVKFLVKFKTRRSTATTEKGALNGGEKLG